jgi:hypothetical protein
MARDPELIAHQEWLGYLQPVGLVVSPPALAAAGAYPNKNIIPDHARFLECVENITLEGESDPRPAIRQFAPFATHVLGWEPADLVGTSEGGSLPDSLEVTLTEYNETLRPTYAVREFSNAAGAVAKWLLLFQKVKAGISLETRPRPRTTAGRPALKPGSSGSCAARRCRSGYSPTTFPCGWFTPHMAKPRAF